MAYALACSEWEGTIPASLLSVHGADVEMPVPPPSQFVVEPHVTTEPVQLWRGPDGGVLPPAAPGGEGLAALLHWPAGQNQWLQVAACLLGEPGRMRCLGPTVQVAEVGKGRRPPGTAAAALAALHAEISADPSAAAQAEEEEGAQGDGEAHEEAAAAAAGSGEDAGEEEEAGELLGSFDLTPPPAGLVMPEAVQTARLRLQMVADRLGISGAAQVDAFMHATTGELVVTGVTALPDLAPGALLFRQVRPGSWERGREGGGSQSPARGPPRSSSQPAI